MSERVAIFPGTFDPVTNGHVDLVERASRVFDRVIVAIADNPQKAPLFSLNERVNLTKQAVASLPNVAVDGFSVLLMDFAREKGACAIVRGLRAVSDFEYEFQMASMNRRLCPDIESLFLTPAETYSFLSSTMVKEVSRYGGHVSAFVPEHVEKALAARWATNRAE